MSSLKIIHHFNKNLEKHSIEFKFNDSDHCFLKLSWNEDNQPTLDDIISEFLRIDNKDLENLTGSDIINIIACYSCLLNKEIEYSNTITSKVSRSYDKEDDFDVSPDISTQDKITRTLEIDTDEINENTANNTYKEIYKSVKNIEQGYILKNLLKIVEFCKTPNSVLLNKIQTIQFHDKPKSFDFADELYEDFRSNQDEQGPDKIKLLKSENLMFFSSAEAYLDYVENNKRKGISLLRKNDDAGASDGSFIEKVISENKEVHTVPNSTFYVKIPDNRSKFPNSSLLFNTILKDLKDLKDPKNPTEFDKANLTGIYKIELIEPVIQTKKNVRNFAKNRNQKNQKKILRYSGKSSSETDFTNEKTLDELSYASFKSFDEIMEKLSKYLRFTDDQQKPAYPLTIPVSENKSIILNQNLELESKELESKLSFQAINSDGVLIPITKIMFEDFLTRLSLPIESKSPLDKKEQVISQAKRMVLVDKVYEHLMPKGDDGINSGIIEIDGTIYYITNSAASSKKNPPLDKPENIEFATLFNAQKLNKDHKEVVLKDKILENKNEHYESSIVKKPFIDLPNKTPVRGLMSNAILGMLFGNNDMNSKNISIIKQKYPGGNEFNFVNIDKKAGIGMFLSDPNSDLFLPMKDDLFFIIGNDKKYSALLEKIDKTFTKDELNSIDHETDIDKIIDPETGESYSYNTTTIALAKLFKSEIPNDKSGTFYKMFVRERTELIDYFDLANTINKRFTKKQLDSDIEESDINKIIDPKTKNFLKKIDPKTNEPSEYNETTKDVAQLFLSHFPQEKVKDIYCYFVNNTDKFLSLNPESKDYIPLVGIINAQVASLPYNFQKSIIFDRSNISELFETIYNLERISDETDLDKIIDPNTGESLIENNTSTIEIAKLFKSYLPDKHSKIFYKRYIERKKELVKSARENLVDIEFHDKGLLLKSSLMMNKDEKANNEEITSILNSTTIELKPNSPVDKGLSYIEYATHRNNQKLITQEELLEKNETLWKVSDLIKSIDILVTDIMQSSGYFQWEKIAKPVEKGGQKLNLFYDEFTQVHKNYLMNIFQNFIKLDNTLNIKTIRNRLRKYKQNLLIELNNTENLTEYFALLKKERDKLEIAVVAKTDTKKLSETIDKTIDRTLEKLGGISAINGNTTKIDKRKRSSDDDGNTEDVVLNLLKLVNEQSSLLAQNIKLKITKRIPDQTRENLERQIVSTFRILKVLENNHVAGSIIMRNVMERFLSETIVNDGFAEILLRELPIVKNLTNPSNNPANTLTVRLNGQQNLRN